MSIPDHERFKAQVIHEVGEMEPYYIQVVYRFIQQIPKRGVNRNKNVDETILRYKTYELLGLIHSHALLKRIYRFVEYLYLHNG